MSKGLEALDKIIDMALEPNGYQNFVNGCDKKYCQIIEKELKRLAKIDDLLEEIGIDENDLPIWYEMQKQDGKKVNALEIIKKHTDSETCLEYLNETLKSKAITQEEYELLKEVLVCH